MLAFGGEGRIEQSRDGDIEIGSGGELTVLGGVEGALEIIDFGTDVNAAGKSFDEAVGGDGIGESGKRWEIAEGEMNFGYSAIGAEIFDALGEGGIELGGVE